MIHNEIAVVLSSKEVSLNLLSAASTTVTALFPLTYKEQERKEKKRKEKKQELKRRERKRRCKRIDTLTILPPMASVMYQLSLGSLVRSLMTMVPPTELRPTYLLTFPLCDKYHCIVLVPPVFSFYSLYIHQGEYQSATTLFLESSTCDTI